MVQSTKNLYEILEVSSAASLTTIKSSYRRLVRKYHPDLNGGDRAFTQKFKELKEAYEILSDSAKRRHYDLMNDIKKSYQSGFKDAKKAYKTSEKPKDEHFSNVFDDILKGFRRTTSSEKKEFKTKQLKPEKGTNIEVEVVIDIKEAIEGTTRVVNILHTQACPNCEGRVFLNGKCPICGGSGEQSTHKKLSVKIPKGVKHLSKIRIANEGNRGYNGGRNGDLYLKIMIQSSDFSFDGLNVLSTVSIAPFEAALGTELEVQTVREKVKMKINAGTQSGQKFRLASQGLESDGNFGDMIVTVMVNVSKNLSEYEKELYKKLRECNEK